MEKDELVRAYAEINRLTQERDVAASRVAELSAALGVVSDYDLPTKVASAAFRRGVLYAVDLLEFSAAEIEEKAAQDSFAASERRAAATHLRKFVERWVTKPEEEHEL